MTHCDIYFLLIFIRVFSEIKGEYHIKDNVIPSYLYHKFNNTKEDVFPSDIRIKLSLSKISGTLFYSIDRLKNQLILSLDAVLEPILSVEFSKQKYDLPLSQLCGCERCQYEPLDIRIQLKDVIYLQCNGRNVQTKAYNRTKLLNEYHPIPFTESEFNTASENTAHVWLVNNPQYMGVYPNHAQLSGCIFDVLYNDQPMIFANISEGVGRICPKTCTNDVCNGGQCLETFQERPVCNCTTSFLNGDYCNDTIFPMNIKSVNSKFQFAMFKLVWNSATNNILILGNSNLEIRISRSEKTLMAEYSLSTMNEQIAKSILTQAYVPNTRCILIVTFNANIIDIKIFVDNTQDKAVILTNRDLRKEIFTMITLRSDMGVIGMSYKKFPKDYSWMNVSIPEYIQLENGKYVNDNKQNISMTEEKRAKMLISIIVPIVIVIVIIVVIVVIVVIVLCKRRRSNILQHPKTYEIIGDELRNLPQHGQHGTSSNPSIPSQSNTEENLRGSSLLITNSHLQNPANENDEETALVETADVEPGYITIGFDNSGTRKEVTLNNEMPVIQGASNNLDRNISVEGNSKKSDDSLDRYGGFVSLAGRPESSSEEETDPYNALVSVRGDEFRRDFIKFPK